MLIFDDDSAKQKKQTDRSVNTRLSLKPITRSMGQSTT